MRSRCPVLIITLPTSPSKGAGQEATEDNSYSPLFLQPFLSLFALRGETNAGQSSHLKAGQNTIFFPYHSLSSQTYKFVSWLIPFYIHIEYNMIFKRKRKRKRSGSKMTTEYPEELQTTLN